ncbi:MAG: HipA domain-containing protein, partial [Candidatus Cloacimonetes bacterium]|nr:HipA domain-containing protein [Candidatus Cloacimonadota bacterium]
KNEFIRIRRNYADKFSISGVQDKISLKIKDNKLIPTDTDGTYILKPIPVNLVPELNDDVPANEHLTMQIARQVFRINTAENGLIRFSDGEFAYISKRFDRKNGEKFQQEDFCQLMNKTPETAGENFKYNSSYEEMGKIVHKFCSAGKIEIEKLFQQILFDYIFSNGDAHLKNFSLIESSYGDFVLSPAYDLINTAVHFPQESRLALDLFTDYETDSFKLNGFYKKVDFLKLAEIFMIKKMRAERFLEEFVIKKEKVHGLIKTSFLRDEAKKRYLNLYDDRMKAIVD